MDKIFAVLNLLRKGSAVANVDAWRKHQITATMLGVAIMALVQLAKAFGYVLPIDDDTATAIAGGAIALINVLLSTVTSDKIGILQSKTADVVGTTDTPSEPVVQAEVPTEPLPERPERPVEPISETYLREAREALNKRDSTYSGS